MVGAAKTEDSMQDLSVVIALWAAYVASGSSMQVESKEQLIKALHSSHHPLEIPTGSVGRSVVALSFPLVANFARVFASLVLAV